MNTIKQVLDTVDKDEMRFFVKEVIVLVIISTILLIESLLVERSCLISGKFCLYPASVWQIFSGIMAGLCLFRWVFALKHFTGIPVLFWTIVSPFVFIWFVEMIIPQVWNFWIGVFIALSLYIGILTFYFIDIEAIKKTFKIKQYHIHQSSPESAKA